MKKYILLLIENIGIAIAAVLIYSPGFLALRISDYNIFRAVMSVTAAVGLVLVFCLVNYRALAAPKRYQVEMTDIKGVPEAKQILIEYRKVKFFGNFAKTAEEQLERTERAKTRLEGMIERKFQKGSLSWDKFYGITQNAEDLVIKNIVFMANRMAVFDESEYKRLQHYKEDEIPDDIQVEQLKLYDNNLSQIKEAISLNERILLKLDTLAMELSTMEASAVKDVNTETLEEIEQLAKQTKYYQ